MMQNHLADGHPKGGHGFKPGELAMSTQDMCDFQITFLRTEMGSYLLM